MSDLFWSSDEKWARIEPKLPKNTRGWKRVDDRRVLSGIVHVLKSGGRLGGLSLRLRSKEDDLQSLREMGRARHMGRHLRSACGA